MRKFLLTVVIVGAVGIAMLLLSMSQNDGCFPWQESVGTQGSPFSGTKDNTVCR